MRHKRLLGSKPLKSALANRSQSRSVSKGRAMVKEYRSRSRDPFERDLDDLGAQSKEQTRRDAFEAKFDKYKANKQQKEYVERRMKTLEQPNFDITTKNPGSPSKLARKYTTVVGAEIDFRPSGKFEQQQLMPEGYEQHLMREQLLDSRKDPFKVLGVSNEDKMSFYLLKYVFNAIKQEPAAPGSDDEEGSLGKPFVAKKDLLSQLSKNPQIMEALEVGSKRELHDLVDQAHGERKGCLTWTEFLNAFFLRGATFSDRIDGNDWWTSFDPNGLPVEPSEEAENEARSDQPRE